MPNLTFEIRSTAGSVVLRRPPSGELLPHAHDMGPKVRVQRALRNTSVPVPVVLLEDRTGDVIGVPYYGMEKVPGCAIRGDLPPSYARTTWPLPRWLPP